MRKVKKFIKCSGSDFDFNVALIGDGKNPRLYFIENDVYYVDEDFDGVEYPIEAGTPAKYIEQNEWLLQMDLKAFKRIAKEILGI
jgi:hypothetical protein